ncbi:hypothetical protein Vafri_5718 [Volvox africanus]|nr:hypothetical protein Vafri_5718 [Volvox africanus]
MRIVKANGGCYLPLRAGSRDPWTCGHAAGQQRDAWDFYLLTFGAANAASAVIAVWLKLVTGICGSDNGEDLPHEWRAMYKIMSGHRLQLVSPAADCARWSQFDYRDHVKVGVASACRLCAAWLLVCCSGGLLRAG